MDDVSTVANNRDACPILYGLSACFVLRDLQPSENASIQTVCTFGAMYRNFTWGRRYTQIFGVEGGYDLVAGR